MKKFGFYLMGKKGYDCISSFVNSLGSECISFVVSARDKGVKDDFFNEISEFCALKGIDFYEKSDPLKKKRYDVSFAIGWRWVISEYDKLIVFHDSLLPKYRGFSPLPNMLINGEKRLGVTALFASEDYDAGNIIEQSSVAIEYPLKVSDAINIVANLYVSLLLKVSRMVCEGKEIIATRQKLEEATFSLWRDDIDYEIDWRKSSEEICRFVDAVGYPYDGAKTIISGRHVRVNDVTIIEDVVVESRDDHVGKVLFMDAEGPTVVCGDGLVKLLNVIDKSGNNIVSEIPFRTRFGG
ncbi:methionyl-tRNA formyltransferase [Halomonas litopenaei]|nr:methionyl-tRNA formyltransferase [Halomonas litopenaei]